MAEGRALLQVQNDRLYNVIADNHKVISASTEATSRLLGVMEQVQDTMQLLVSQITTNINQRNDAVPLKVVLLMIGVLVVVILTTVGLDATNLYHIGNGS